MTLRALILAALALVPTTVLASADLPINADDRKRLDQYETARTEAIATAKAGGEAADLEALEAVLAGEPQPIRGADIRGTYQCRSAQLAGSCRWWSTAGSAA